MVAYLYELKDWPNFHWVQETLSVKLGAVRHRQGKIMGHMEALGFPLQEEAMLAILTLDIVKTNEIEGELLNPEQVRSSVARKLGMDVPGLIPSDRHIEGVVEMMLDATLRYDLPLTEERLFDWHAAMFPTGRSGMYKITVGDWRDDSKGPMQVVSGAAGKEHVHFQAPHADIVSREMKIFLDWFNGDINIDPVLKAAVAHLWFLTIHPFADGNGRIARAVADMQLARADQTSLRFYSMSAQIKRERNAYYKILEKTQKGSLDITRWLEWFIDCLERTLIATEDILSAVLKKARYWDKHMAVILNERQRLMINKLFDGFEGNLTSSKWAKMTKCSQDTALRDIQYLIDKGMLQKSSSAGKNTNYVLKTD
ncbi:Fic family protein [Chitinophaga filiformis]|uniref:Fic family protein n=1 Tax=Chitinophaga filiformis TaxID=104663 RepID=A0ABY4I2Z8_CHIFI|nr:Fic family protein [Chitinophaga filiformis]UPK70003.1 Fic family protein [Chitinophaga filiformis]